MNNISGFITFILSVCALSVFAEEGARVALINGTVIDGTGAAPLRNAVVLIDGDRIAGVAARDRIELPEDTRIIDVWGKTVLPGFIDLHMHLMYPPSAELQSNSLATLRAAHFMNLKLKAGITSIRDVGGTVEPMQALLQGRERGYLDSVRLFPAGQIITTPGGHGPAWSKYVSGPEGFRKAVRDNYEAGFHHVKLSPPYTAAEIEAAVAEAKQLGMQVTCHGGGGADTVPPTMTKIAVVAGVDSIEHLNPVPDEVLDLIAEKQIGLVPTLAIYRIVYQRDIPFFKKVVEARGWTIGTHETQFRKAYERRIPMGIGTDAVAYFMDETAPGLYFEEMKYFRELGMKPMEFIVAATGNGARILGREKELGTLEPGKFADLQVVDGDPLATFDMLGKPLLVMVGGQIKYRRQ